MFKQKILVDHLDLEVALNSPEENICPFCKKQVNRTLWIDLYDSLEGSSEHRININIPTICKSCAYEILDTIKNNIRKNSSFTKSKGARLINNWFTCCVVFNIV